MHDWLTVAEAAELAGIQPGSIRMAIWEGRLDAERRGPRILMIERVELDRYINERNPRFRTNVRAHANAHHPE